MLRAARQLNISLAESVLVGDKLSDIEAARAAGVGRAYLVAAHDIHPKDVPQVDGLYPDLKALASDLSAGTGV